MRGKRLRTKREALEFQTPPRTPRWEMSAPAVSAVGMREPRKCGEEPRAVRPPPLPPSSPAPRQYARELMTTEVIITQLRSTGISRTNKPGVPRILRALRGQFLVTLTAHRLSSPRKRGPILPLALASRFVMAGRRPGHPATRSIVGTLRWVPGSSPGDDGREGGAR